MTERPKAGGPERKALPAYTISLALVFVAPFLFLWRTIRATVEMKPFAVTVALVCALGWAWSILLSARGWWEFPEEFILGVRVLPHLPLEEFLIYPLGGAFSIFFYVWAAKRRPAGLGRLGRPNPAAYAVFAVGVAAAFGGLALAHASKRPYYLYSQLVLYNGIVLAALPWTMRTANPAGLVVSVGGLSLVGFVWDYLAFKWNWWVYHAITGVRVANIPIEDFNFYLMAPTAAISLYLCAARLFKRPP